jgi:glycine cleavage system aminomethyltransferase T
VNLDFLTPSADGAVARSPMERSAAEEGARFELRDGWSIAVEYRGDPEVATRTAAWADVSHLPKLELHGPGELLDELAGQPLPFGTAIRRNDAWWCRLTTNRALVIGAHVDDTPGIRQTDVTTTFAALTLVGPLAREVFARFSAIDLRPPITPPGALRPGSIARQPGILICEAEDRYLMLFGWATGEYVWSVVSDATHHLGGRPIGVDALAKLPSAQEPARA